MFRRRKRMEFAQPGERRRREETESAAGESAITRRVFLVRGAVGASFLALGGKLWQMQIAKGGSYQRVAEGNVLRFERLKAPRGRIVDRTGAPLAVSRRAWTVSVIPSRLPADEEERKAVLDNLASTLQLKEALVLERAALPVGSEAAVVNELEKRLGIDGTTLLARITAPGATIALLKDELEPADAQALEASCSDLPGVKVMNTLDYELAVHAYEDVAMPIKKDVDPEIALRVAANVLYLPGVVVDDDMLIRQYPGGPGFSHILGYVGPITGEEWTAAQDDNGAPIYDQDDVVGRGGMESALEAQLRGAKGGRWIQVDSAGVERFELLERRKEPVSGMSAQLTINKAFQDAVVNALQDGIKFANDEAVKAGKDKVGAGVAIAMDPRNGEILAMASLPTFDNQLFVNGISDEQWAKYRDDPFQPLLDRAVGGLFPPGSTLKPLLACAGLQERVITTETKFTCKGRITVPWSWDETQGNDYPCWLYDTGHGQVDIYNGIAQSCDIYFYNVGAPKQKPEEPANADFVHYYDLGDPNTRHYFDGLGIERIERYLREVFGFGQQSGIELADEQEGLVPNPKWLFQSDLHEYWSVGDTINVSIGQGHLLCTPLQLLNGTVRIANGGTLWKPRLIKALQDEQGNVVREFAAEPLVTTPLDVKRGLATVDPQHLAVVREGMRRTVTEGTAKDQITFTDPIIGAKSGTAEFGEAINGKYAEGHAWFSAFAPFDNPEIAVVVLVVGGQQGSVYAGPIANRILDEYFHTPGLRTT